MNNLVELEKVEAEVKELTRQVTYCKEGLSTLTREFIMLRLKETALSDNIKNLKKITIIVKASEFKQSKDDLKRTKIRLDMVKQNKLDLEKALEKTEAFLVKSLEKLEELNTKTKSNLLVGSFGKKND